MSNSKWSTLRCQNVNHLNGLFTNDEERIIRLDDVPIVLIRIDNYLLLKESHEKLLELEGVINKTRELQRDLKIAKANLEYEESLK